MPLKQEELRYAHTEGHTDVCYFEDGEYVFIFIQNILNSYVQYTFLDNLLHVELMEISEYGLWMKVLILYTTVLESGH